MKQAISAFVLMAVVAFTGFGLSSSAQADEGSLFGYGANHAGQSNVPTGENYVAIEADYDHSLALKEGGSIVSWGYDSTPAPTGNDFVAIATGNGYCLALKEDGSIAAWGLDNFGQATSPEGNDFIAIDAGFYHSVALRADGSIAAWGDNKCGQATPPEGNDFVAISAGHEYCLALKEDGSIVGWGRNDYGQATAPTGTDFVAVDAGSFNSIALKADGAITAWGSSFYSLDTPPAIPADGKVYVAISAGPNHYLALVAEQPALPTVEELIAEIEDGIRPELQAIFDELPSEKIEKALNKLNKVRSQLAKGELSCALKKIVGVMGSLCGAEKDGYDVTGLQLDIMTLAVTIVSIGIEEALEMGIDISVAQASLECGDEAYNLGKDRKAVRAYAEAIELLEALSDPNM
jgi:hypothetical protein